MTTTDVRCRWLGPTPSMVVWWLRPPCPLIDQFASYYRRPTQPVAANQCLKPLATISDAALRGSILGDWAVLRADDPRVPGCQRVHDLGFSISESTGAFGGDDAVQASCRSCVANLPSAFASARECSTPDASPSPFWQLAGCSQWLLFGQVERVSEQSQALQATPLPLVNPGWKPFEASESPATVTEVVMRIHASGSLRRLLNTSNPWETWFRFWHRESAVGTVSVAFLEAAITDLQSWFTDTGELDWSQEPATPSGWLVFCLAVQVALQHGVPLATQYIPRGFSDGYDWWLGPHCSRCGADQAIDTTSCTVCGRTGGPIPAQKRRIMGWSPYRPLTTQLLLLSLCERWAFNK